MNSNNEIQGYKLYPMLHFRRKFSSSVTVANLVRRVGVVLLNNLSGFGTGSVIPACCAAKVWRLLVLVSKGMFSQVELLVLLAVLSDV